MEQADRRVRRARRGDCYHRDRQGASALFLPCYCCPFPDPTPETSSLLCLRAYVTGWSTGKLTTLRSADRCCCQRPRGRHDQGVPRQRGGHCHRWPGHRPAGAWGRPSRGRRQIRGQGAPTGAAQGRVQGAGEEARVRVNVAAQATRRETRAAPCCLREEGNRPILKTVQGDQGCACPCVRG